MNLFYADPAGIQENSLIIRGQEADHITKVLRHSAGDRLIVTDGRGNCYTCRIRHSKKSSVFLDVLQVEQISKPQTFVTLCMGVIKKRDRMEFAVEKAVEIGASKIVLFKGEYSQKGNVREDRLINTAVSAMKQSLRYYLPKIFIENSLPSALSAHTNNSVVVVADETKEVIKKEIKSVQNYFLIVGPEGGFSDKEREYLKTVNPEWYSLGEKRLRTETAAILMIDRFLNFQ